jgi:hypothetical protein
MRVSNLVYRSHIFSRRPLNWTRSMGSSQGTTTHPMLCIFGALFLRRSSLMFPPDALVATCCRANTLSDVCLQPVDMRERRITQVPCGRMIFTYNV